MAINRSIFKAYDVRGLYPSEVNEEAARLIGRGFVAYLGARRIAVSAGCAVESGDWTPLERARTATIRAEKYADPAWNSKR